MKKSRGALLRERGGVMAMEYALIGFVLAIVVVAGATQIGGVFPALFNAAAATLASAAKS